MGAIFYMLADMGEVIINVVTWVAVSAARGLSRLWHNHKNFRIVCEIVLMLLVMLAASVTDIA